MTEVITGSVALEGGEICSEEDCGRPAVYGTDTFRNGLIYNCEGHYEIGLEQGSLDWIADEIMMVEDWLSQVGKMPESAWAGVGDLKHVLILWDEVSEHPAMSYKWQHEGTLRSLAAALDVARKLTQEKIDRLEKRLEGKAADSGPS